MCTYNQVQNVKIQAYGVDGSLIYERTGYDINLHYAYNGVLWNNDYGFFHMPEDLPLTRYIKIDNLGIQCFGFTVSHMQMYPDSCNPPPPSSPPLPPPAPPNAPPPPRSCGQQNNVPIALDTVSGYSSEFAVSTALDSRYYTLGVVQRARLNFSYDVYLGSFDVAGEMSANDPFFWYCHSMEIEFYDSSGQKVYSTVAHMDINQARLDNLYTVETDVLYVRYIEVLPREDGCYPTIGNFAEKTYPCPPPSPLSKIDWSMAAAAAAAAVGSKAGRPPD